jgi:hypothetical protein
MTKFNKKAFIKAATKVEEIMSTPSKDREELRERILTLNCCIGPFDAPHRCSSRHCGHCGLCDMSEELINLVLEDRNSLKQSLVAEKETIAVHGGNDSLYPSKHIEAVTIDSINKVFNGRM